MKVHCLTNALSDQLLTAHHRDFFERWFGADGIRWGAEPGATYTVHGINITRGYPFYWIRIRELPALSGPEWVWRQFPSLCFEIVDPRPSALWRANTGVHGAVNGDQYFFFRMWVQAWFDEPGFLEHLVDQRPRELEIMTRLGDEMDREFEADLLACDTADRERG